MHLGILGALRRRIAFRGKIETIRSKVRIRGKLPGDWSVPTSIRDSTIDILACGEGCRIRDAICRGKVELGRFVSITGPSRVLARKNPIRIGSFSSIASFVIMQEYNHRMDRASTYFFSKNIAEGDADEDISSKGPIMLGEDVWVGAGAIVLSGVAIGRGAVIGAGAVVTRDVEPYAVVGGNPARKIKDRFSRKSVQELEESRWWEWDMPTIMARLDFFEMTRE